MGLSADAIDAMSLWQFSAAIDGWNKHHSPEDEKGGVPLSDEEADEIARWLDQR